MRSLLLTALSLVAAGCFPRIDPSFGDQFEEGYFDDDTAVAADDTAVEVDEDSGDDTADSGVEDSGDDTGTRPGVAGWVSQDGPVPPDLEAPDSWGADSALPPESLYVEVVLHDDIVLPSDPEQPESGKAVTLHVSNARVGDGVKLEITSSTDADFNLFVQGAVVVDDDGNEIFEASFTFADIRSQMSSTSEFSLCDASYTVSYSAGGRDWVPYDIHLDDTVCADD